MSSEVGANQKKPNVFFIMIDDMGYNDIGYQSIDLQGVTPNLDKLAAGGIKMKEYYSMQICTPARASLMTGRYVVRYGLQYSVIQPGAPWGLPLNEKIFPQYMKDAGYETHMIGKWHIGSYTHSHIPSQRGFDTYLGYLNDEEMYWTHQSWTANLHGRKFFDFGFGNATGYYDVIDRPLPDHVRNGSLTTEDDDHTMLSPTTTYSSSLSDTSDEEESDFKGHYSTQVFQDRAIDILKGKTPHDEEPLYMYLSHQAVHDPLGLPPDGVFNDQELTILDKILASCNDNRHLRQRFAKVLMYLDHTIGELVKYLTTEGWMENSIIVVPAFIYSESHIPEGRRGTEYNGLMHVTDWLPTLATAAGLELDGSAGPLDGIDHWDQIRAGPLDGIDHWEYLVNTEFSDSNDSPRQEMMYNFDPYILWADSGGSIENAELNVAQGAFRQGNYKYLSKEVCSGCFTFDELTNYEDPLTNTTTQCGGSNCMNCGQSCTSYNTSDSLFDVVADPREEHNLIFAHPEIAHNMRKRWVEVAFQEYSNSTFETIDRLAYYVWENYNWWMAPWWNLVSGNHADVSASSADGTRATSCWTGIVANDGRVPEILRRLDELQEHVRNRDGVVQQLQLDDVMADASPSRRRRDDEAEPVLVGTATTPLSSPVVPRAPEDDHVIATNNKEDLSLWLNSQYGKRWCLTGQRPLEATMTLVIMSMRLRKVAAVDQEVLSMMNNLGAFDVRAMKAPNDAISTSIDLPERLAIFIDALMAVVSRGVCGAVGDARLDALRRGMQNGASVLRQHATAHRSAMREPANYDVLADIINDDVNEWAGDIINEDDRRARRRPPENEGTSDGDAGGTGSGGGGAGGGNGGNNGGRGGGASRN
eukprot:g14340.t1